MDMDEIRRNWTSGIMVWESLPVAWLLTHEEIHCVLFWGEDVG